MFWVLGKVLLWKSLLEGEIEERMSGAMVDVAGIFDNAKELDRLKKDLEEVFLDINKIHKKLQSAPEMHEKSGKAVFTLLRELCVKAKVLSKNITNTLMGQLDA